MTEKELTVIEAGVADAQDAGCAARMPAPSSRLTVHLLCTTIREMNAALRTVAEAYDDACEQQWVGWFAACKAARAAMLEED